MLCIRRSRTEQLGASCGFRIKLLFAVVALTRGSTEIIESEDPKAHEENPRKLDGCNGSEYLDCRANLAGVIFGGGATTQLTTVSLPDEIIDLPNYTMKGLPGPGKGITHFTLLNSVVILVEIRTDLLELVDNLEICMWHLVSHCMCCDAAPVWANPFFFCTGTGVGDVAWKIGLQKLIFTTGLARGGTASISKVSLIRLSSYVPTSEGVF